LQGAPSFALFCEGWEFMPLASTDERHLNPVQLPENMPNNVGSSAHR
jgi:hypothetical protein